MHNMKKSSYILRIDDVCPTMRRNSFERIRAVCDKLDIQPMIGIIPDNQDPKLRVERQWPDFWDVMNNLANNRWIIAQHGYQHLYNKHKTEFAGLTYDEQFRKISLGHSILTKKLECNPKWFMAPSHSLDATTCEVLRKLSFTHVTDGTALYPFMQYGLIWVPQQLWRPISTPFGLWTICIHPDTMSNKEINSVIRFITIHAQQFKNVSLEPQKSLFTIPMRIAWNIALATTHIWHT